MSFLTMVQDAADEVGIKRPSTLVGGTTTDQRQLIALADRVGRDIANAANWQYLKKEGTITLATSDQDYAFPADYDRLIPSTMWDRTDSRPVLIPESSQNFQRYEGWAYVSTLNLRAYIRGNEVVFQQDITAAENGKVINFEYISDQWCESSGGTGQSEFAADTDVTRHDEYLHRRGIVYMYKRAKQLPDWQLEERDFRKELKKRIAFDKSARNVALSGKNIPKYVYNVPEGGWG